MPDKLFGKNVSAEGAAPVDLRPAPIPSSTFVRPQQREVGQNAARLADSLGGLNRALMAYGSMAAQQRNDPQVQKDFENSLYGKTDEELRAMAAQGLPKLQQEALGVILGNRLADQWQRDIAEFSTTEFDQSAGNLGGGGQQAPPDGPSGAPDGQRQGRLLPGHGRLHPRLLMGDLERRVKSAEGELHTGILSQYRNIATEGLHGKRAGTEIADEIIKASSANRDFLRLDGPTQNGLLMQLAGEFAEQGHEDLVAAILDHPRNGVGPIGKTAAHIEQALTIREQARRRRYQLTAETNTETLRPASGPRSDYRRREREGHPGVEAAHGPLGPQVKAGIREQSDMRREQLLQDKGREEAKLAVLQRQQDTKLQAARDAATAAATGTWHELNGYTTVTDTGEEKFVDAAKQREEYRDNYIRAVKADPKLSPEQKQATLFQFAKNTGEEIPEWTALLAGSQIAAGPEALTRKDAKLPRTWGRAEALP
jgi:hypothetical protein